MKKLILILCLIFTYSFHLFATVQIPDRIIYKGKEYNLVDEYPRFLLEDYFLNYLDEKPDILLYPPSTALWRGYIAVFELHEGELYIKQILIKDRNSVVDNEWKNVLAEIFPGKVKVKMDWYTGVLVIPTGKKKPNSYSHECSSYTLLEVTNGNIETEKNFTRKEFKKFKKKQFKVFKETEAYKQKIKAMKENNPSASLKLLNSIIQDDIFFFTNKFLISKPN